MKQQVNRTGKGDRETIALGTYSKNKVTVKKLPKGKTSTVTKKGPTQVLRGQRISDEEF